MGAVKEMLIEQTEWLEEKLNSVKDESTPEYTYDMCQDIIMNPVEWFDVKSCSTLYEDLWRIAQLSPEDGNKLIDISEDLYVLAMEEHE